MDSSMKNTLIALAAGAMGLTMSACGSDAAEPAAGGGTEMHETGGEASCGAGSCGGEAGHEEGGEASCGAGSCGGESGEEGGEASCGAGSCGG